MKKNFTIIIILLLSLSLSGQITLELSGTVINKSIPAINIDGAEIEVGKRVRILEYGTYSYPDGTSTQGYLVNVDRQTYAIKANHLNRIKFDEAPGIEELWSQIVLNSDLPEAYAKYGYQYDIRNELEEEAREMINLFYTQNLLYRDDYLEAYMQSMLNRIQPDTYHDRRPGHLDIKIISSGKPDSYSLPDGTIVVTTGLISLLNSEEELLAILTHEVAHYVLDHQLVNYNAQVTREKRAIFWSGVATGLAAAGEVYLNINNDIYTGGALTMSTAILSTSIAQNIVSRLGIEYSMEQEDRADQVTGLILDMLEIDSTALASVLVKTEAYYRDHENYYELSPNGPHSMLTHRIRNLGNPGNIMLPNPEYDKKVSLVHSHNAILHLHSKESESSIRLCDRNIDAGIALEDDYIVKALAIRQMSDNAAGDLEALRLLQTAESLNLLPNINVYKQQGISYMRLDMKEEARKAFDTYWQNLEALPSNEYVNSELTWTRAMIHKTDVL